jgi:hypothetical protein
MRVTDKIDCFLVKAKPVVRQGRKATGLREIAGLPEAEGDPAFHLQGEG